MSDVRPRHHHYNHHHYNHHHHIRQPTYFSKPLLACSILPPLLTRYLLIIQFMYFHFLFIIYPGVGHL